MTNVPEVFLAREAQMAYATMGIVTDYDCWMDDPASTSASPPSWTLYRASAGPRACAARPRCWPRPLPPEAEIRSALADAMLTPDEAMDDAQREWLEVLRR